MSLDCFETGQAVENPFYWISTVVKDPETGKTYISLMEIAISQGIFGKIPSAEVKDSPDIVKDGLFYSVQEAYGQEGIFGVQLLGGFAAGGNLKYVSRQTAEACFPRTARYMTTSRSWWSELENGKRGEPSADLEVKCKELLAQYTMQESKPA